jgi:hypothetical protein
VASLLDLPALVPRAMDRPRARPCRVGGCRASAGGRGRRRTPPSRQRVNPSARLS